MITFHTRKILPSTLAFIVWLLSATLVNAQPFIPLAPTPGNSKLAQLYQSTDLGNFFSILFVTALSVGAIIAVLRLAYAGYQYMTTDAWGSKMHAKEIIGEVVLGLLLLLGVWLILKQINPQILNLDILQRIGPGGVSVPIRPQQQSGSTMQQFATQPAQNSFFGGAGGQYDSSINGLNTGSGCDGAC